MSIRVIGLFLSLVLLFAAPLTASIIKRPPEKTGELAYKDLVCTAEHQGCIYEIISTMAENNKLTLLFKQSHLKELGDKISEVHPMKFMSTIFTHPYLRSCMPSIWSDYFKRTGFMDGLGPSLTREMERGKLVSLIDDFSTEVNIPAHQLRPYFEVQDWDSLIQLLMGP